MLLEVHILTLKRIGVSRTAVRQKVLIIDLDRANSRQKGTHHRPDSLIAFFVMPMHRILTRQ